MLIACLFLRSEREICAADVFARGVEGHLRAWAQFDQHVSEITYAINRCTPFVDPETFADLDAFADAIRAVPIEAEEEEEEQPPSSTLATRLLAIEARLDALEGKGNVAVAGMAMGQPLSNSTTTTTTTTHVAASSSSSG